MGHKLNVAFSQLWLAEAALAEGNLTLAQTLYGEGLATYRPAGHSNVAVALRGLGEVALRRGDIQRARALGDESLAWCTQINNEEYPFDSSLYLARVAAAEGNYVTVTRLYKEALVSGREKAARPNVVKCLEGLASVVNAERNHERATRLFGAAEALREAMGAQL